MIAEYFEFDTVAKRASWAIGLVSYLILWLISVLIQAGDNPTIFWGAVLVSPFVLISLLCFGGLIWAAYDWVKGPQSYEKTKWKN